MSLSGRGVVYPCSVANSKLRLFCFPHAGAGVAAFRSWYTQKNLQVELAIIRLPGREVRLNEVPFTRMEPLVEALVVDVISEIQTPFAIFGHCFGGLIAFELVRELQRRNAPLPTTLCVSDCVAPHIPDNIEPMSQLSEAQFIQALKRLGDTPSEILENEELRDLILPTLRADFAIAENYVYAKGIPIECPIHAFVSANRKDAIERVAAWNMYTSKSFSMHIQDDHQSLMSREGLLVLTSAIGLDV